MTNISIVCKDFDLTESIKTYVNEKMGSLNKFFSNDIDAVIYKVRLGKTTNKQSHGKIFFIDVGIKTPKKNFGCNVESEDIYVAIDRVKDELTRSIVQYKDKSVTESRREDKKVKNDLRSSS